MPSYLITNTQSGADIGVFEAADEWSAYSEMCRDAGYARPQDDPTRDEMADGQLPESIKIIKLA